MYIDGMNHCICAQRGLKMFWYQCIVKETELGAYLKNKSLNNYFVWIVNYQSIKAVIKEIFIFLNFYILYTIMGHFDFKSNLQFILLYK